MLRARGTFLTALGCRHLVARHTLLVYPAPHEGTCPSCWTRWREAIRRWNESILTRMSQVSTRCPARRQGRAAPPRRSASRLPKHDWRSKWGPQPSRRPLQEGKCVSRWSGSAKDLALVRVAGTLGQELGQSARVPFGHDIGDR